MKVAIYSRVSTDKQTNDSQLHELREHCGKRGWTNVKEYSDVITGAKFSRSGLDSLMTDVRRGRVDTLLCFRLDRLGRSLRHLAGLISELLSNQVALIIPAQGIDLTSGNACAQFQLHILMAVAEFEKALIQERVVAGLRAAKARGVRLGKRPTLHKYQQAVSELVNQGKGIREIARTLNLPIASTHKLVHAAKQHLDLQFRSLEGGSVCSRLKHSNLCRCRFC